MLQALNWFARGFGILCALAASGAWAFALWVPTAGLTLTGVSVVMALVLVAFAVFAAIACAYGHTVVVALLFLASFFPIGAFLLTTDHWLRYVGWLDLGLLVATVLMWATARRLVRAS
jgi:hypothetical protein